MKKYENYISIGSNCFTSMLLNKLNLRKEGYPLDWVISTPDWVLKYFKSNFKNYYLPDKKSNTNYLGQEFVWFQNHKFSKANEHYKENNTDDGKLSIYEDNKLKFDRRIERILKLLESNESILFVYTTEYRITDSFPSKMSKILKENEEENEKKLIELKEYFTDKYPEKKIDILVIYLNKISESKIEKKNNIYLAYEKIKRCNDNKQRHILYKELEKFF